ncbi:MAG: nucleotidyltransferase family protein [Nitrospirae bacterium]|nr:nucleotidyltransferase family protein [Nitrospirota bacterium]
MSHGVSGVLYRELTGDTAARETAGVPADVMARLRADFLRISAYRLANEKAIRELDEAVAGSGLRVCLIQGAALPYVLYASPGMRPMCDIDLLVRADALPRLTGLLASLGYAAESEAPVVYTRGTVTLDVHTEPVEFSRFGGVTPLSVTADDVLGEAGPLTRPGGLLVPSGPDVFILACAHLMKHSFMRLIWFHDIILLSRYTGIGPDELWKRADMLGLVKPVRMSLELAKAYQGFDAGFPPPPRGLGFLEARMLAALSRSGPVNGAGDLLYIAGMDTFQGRLSYMRSALSPPSRDALPGGTAHCRNTGDTRAGRLGRNIRLCASAAYSLLKGSMA